MALLRAWLKSGEASLLQRIVDVIEQASAMYEREHLEPNTHEHLETFEVWLRHREWLHAQIAKVLSGLPDNQDATIVIDNLKHRTSVLAGEALAVRFRIGAGRDIEAPQPFSFRSRHKGV